jgi:glycosyltransferase involved in cell wall biosynthesis
LTDLLEMGGAETQLVSLVGALAPETVRPSVGLLRGEGALADSITAPLTRYRMRGPFDLRVIARIASQIRREGILAIYTTHVRSTLIARLLRLLVRPSPSHRRLVVITSEHSYIAPPARPLPDRLRRLTARLSDRVIAVSHAQAGRLRALLRIDPEHVLVIPNGVDPDRFTELPDSEAARREFGIGPQETVFACIARLEPVKDHQNLLVAMEEVEGHLILVGDGSCRGVLTELARSPSLSGRVHFAGTRDDVRTVLAAASAVCLSSIDESQGIALVEAMAAARPVVATGVGGVPEIVEDGVTGFLVPPKQPRALAQALQRVAADPEWRRRAGNAARARVAAEFSIHHRARKTEELLIDLVRGVQR